ncbi:MAG: heme-binding protein [Acidisphaera sp.]|nr:heme-binding protein [Acidisphaera sp.]
MKKVLLAFALALLLCPAARADDADAPAQPCSIPVYLVQAVQSQLRAVVQLDNGGIFSPNRMWSAVVDRDGILCSVTKVGDAWPGSRAIAIAKAETANDFSNDALSLSTAMLYAATQPGGSLYGLNNSNPFNPKFNAETTQSGSGTGVGHDPGGIITFGGGVALYVGGKVIGGLGVSGDSSCADHTIAYRMRRAVHLDGIPTGIMASDNIQYPPTGQPPTGFEQPHCFPQDLAPGAI